MYTWRLPLILACSVAAFAADLPKVALQAAETAVEHKVLLRDGIAAHDEKRYEDAIQLYRQILSENADDIVAIYEIAFSQSVSGDYLACVDTAVLGARYQSDLLNQFRMMLANCLDYDGQSNEAITIFKKSVNKEPENYLLRYNYAVTLESLDRFDDALRQVKIAATLNPAHASSHAMLSRLYVTNGERIPGILAGLRFLVLEPNSERSAKTLRAVHGLMLGSVEQEGEGNVTITVSPDADSREGSFFSAELMLGVANAAADIVDEEDPKPKLTPVARAAMLVGSIVEGSQMGNEKPGKREFAARYYVPYFASVDATEMTDTLIYIAYSSSNWDEVVEWLATNAERVADFKARDERYDVWQGAAITNH
jgi:tetratricopeptide (TPR) repeat protein